jgi:hypothetical protein
MFTLRQSTRGASTRFTNFSTVLPLGLPHPGVLPRNLDVLIIAAIANIRAIAVAEFQSLVPGDGDRDRASDARVRRSGEGVFDAVQTCFPTEPVIAIKCCCFQNYLGSGAHLVKRWSTLASRSEPG